jgi:hypothetical protein
MIKFKADGPDGPVYGFGLTRGNVKRLMAGQPIVINLPDVGARAARSSSTTGRRNWRSSTN